MPQDDSARLYLKIVRMSYDGATVYRLRVIGRSGWRISLSLSRAEAGQTTGPLDEVGPGTEQGTSFASDHWNILKGQGDEEKD